MLRTHFDWYAKWSEWASAFKYSRTNEYIQGQQIKASQIAATFCKKQKNEHICTLLHACAILPHIQLKE